MTSQPLVSDLFGGLFALRCRPLIHHTTGSSRFNMVILLLKSYFERKILSILTTEFQIGHGRLTVGLIIKLLAVQLLFC